MFYPSIHQLMDIWVSMLLFTHRILINIEVLFNITLMPPEYCIEQEDSLC